MKTLVRLGVDIEVRVLRVGPQKSPYSGLFGRIVEERILDGMFRVILDEDPVPRWRNLGVWCSAKELRAVDDD